MMRKLPIYIPLGVGPWSTREQAFHGVGRAMQFEAERLGGAVVMYQLRRNGKQSYGARGEIRMKTGAKRIVYYEAGVI